MDKQTHIALFHLYASRLTLGDLENLWKRQTECIRQQLNGNNTGQLEADNAFYAAVCNAVNNISEYDLNLISDSITITVE